MPYLHDFNESTNNNTDNTNIPDDSSNSTRNHQSSLSERIKALETAGIIDSFVKKRVPPYAAAAAAVGSSLTQQHRDSLSSSHQTLNDPNTSKSGTKIYRNPSGANFPIIQQQQTNRLAASSSTNLHSSSSRESLASNEAAPGGLAMFRSASMDSIENEMANRGVNNELPSSFQTELADRIRTLRKVSIVSSGGMVKENGSEIPINIPLESVVNRISISSPSPAPNKPASSSAVESNSSSSLSSSLNNNNNKMGGVDDLYKTSFVIFPGGVTTTNQCDESSMSHLNSHSPIATLDFKIPITNGFQTSNNKTIIHIDSQYTAQSSSPSTANASSYAELPANCYAKSTGPYVEESVVGFSYPQNHFQHSFQHQNHQHHQSGNNCSSNNRSQLVSRIVVWLEFFVFFFLNNWRGGNLFKLVLSWVGRFIIGNLFK